MSRLIVYTDGSAINNGNADSRCGWACKFVYDGQERMVSGSAKGMTNNQMEMIAALNAMQMVTEKSIPVTIYSDSKYLVETMNGNYRIGANKDLWKKLMAERKKFSDIQFVWVRGHSDNVHNIDVDNMAVKQARSV